MQALARSDPLHTFDPVSRLAGITRDLVGAAPDLIIGSIADNPVLSPEGPVSQISRAPWSCRRHGPRGDLGKDQCWPSPKARASSISSVRLLVRASSPNGAGLRRLGDRRKPGERPTSMLGSSRRPDGDTVQRRERPHAAPQPDLACRSSGEAGNAAASSGFRTGRRTGYPSAHSARALFHRLLAATVKISRANSVRRSPASERRLAARYLTDGRMLTALASGRAGRTRSGWS